MQSSGNQAASLESQVIQQTQELSGRTLRQRTGGNAPPVSLLIFRTIARNAKMSRQTNQCYRGWKIVVALFAIAAVPFAMAATNTPITVAPAAPGAESSNSIQTPYGQRLNVKLPAQLGTGFSWTLANDPKPFLTLMATRVSPASTAMGGVQTQEFEFNTDKAGETTLVFEYRRPWEKNVPPARIYTLSVKIAAR
jgi:inhibitor of cysteine peptidase